MEPALPDEIVLLVLSFVPDPRDICMFACTCKQMDLLSRDPWLWRHFDEDEKMLQLVPAKKHVMWQALLTTTYVPLKTTELYEKGEKLLYTTRHGTFTGHLTEDASEFLKHDPCSVLHVGDSIIATNMWPAGGFGWQIEEGMRKDDQIGYTLRYKGIDYCLICEKHGQELMVVVGPVRGLSDAEVLSSLYYIRWKFRGLLVGLAHKGQILVDGTRRAAQLKKVPAVLCASSMFSLIVKARTEDEKRDAMLVCANTSTFIKEHHLEAKRWEYLSILEAITRLSQNMKVGYTELEGIIRQTAAHNRLMTVNKCE